MSWIWAGLVFVTLATQTGWATESGGLNPPTLTEIRIGFTPSGDKEILKKAALILAKQIQNQLNIPITVYIPKSYTSLAQAIKDKKVDFALMSAAGYVALEQEAQMRVLLKQVWAEPFYYSTILVPKDSAAKRIEDLQGKRIAFVDSKSSSGYLYPKVMLKKKGLSDTRFSQIVFTGSHAKSVALMEAGGADAIAVFSDDVEGQHGAWQKFVKDPQRKNNVRVIWTSEPIPDDPFCVRQDFYDRYPKTVQSLMVALIDSADQLKESREVMQIIGTKGFLPATSRQYDPVREMMKELGKDMGVGL